MVVNGCAETCRVITPNKREKKLHLIGIYMTSIVCTYYTNQNINQIANSDIKIILRDFNAKVGKE